MTAPDQLAAIRERVKAYAEHGTPGLAAPADRRDLLAIVDAQQAALDKYAAEDSDAFVSRQVGVLRTTIEDQRAALVSLEADVDGELQDAEPSNYEEDNYAAGYIAGLAYAQDKLRAAITGEGS